MFRVFFFRDEFHEFFVNRIATQNLKPTLPTATRTLSEREAADVRFGLKKGGKTTATTPRKREDEAAKKETPTKNL